MDPLVIDVDAPERPAPAPEPKTALSQLLKVALRRFREAKTGLVMRFCGGGKQDVTLAVWDFGGQKVPQYTRWRVRGHDIGRPW